MVGAESEGVRRQLRGHELTLKWCKIRISDDAIAAVEVQDVNLNHNSMIQSINVEIGRCLLFFFYD